MGPLTIISLASWYCLSVRRSTGTGPASLGRVYALHLDLGTTSNVFLTGHRIRLEVSSSNFPRFDRNSNTGGTIATESKEDVVQAINRVSHNDVFPSHLVFPIIERESADEGEQDA
jgi:putative CocE/NonD family hydrolase